MKNGIPIMPLHLESFCDKSQAQQINHAGVLLSQRWSFEDMGHIGVEFCSKISSRKIFFDWNFTDFQSGGQKLIIVLENKDF